MPSRRPLLLAPLALALGLAACGDEEEKQQQTYTLTIVHEGNGAGTVTGTGIACGDDCTETYTAGTEVTLLADPALGDALDFWDGCSQVAGDTCTVTMNADVTVTAAWAATFR